MSLKILYDHHSPFILAHGGFQIQIEQTISALRHKGLDVDHLRWWDDKTLPNIVHYFGPAPSWYLNFCKDKGIKTVVSVLLTSHGSRSPSELAFQGAIIRICRKVLPGLAERMGWNSFTQADGYICLTRHEASLLHNVFGTPECKISIVPNGVEECFFNDSSALRENWIISTATIAPRKRVIELAKAAAIAEREIRFYGRPYSKNDPYYLSFLRTVEEHGEFVKYYGDVPDRAALAGLYRQAGGFALISSMESQSLSALEACASGCPLLLADLPWARETFGEAAIYVAPRATPHETACFLRTLDSTGTFTKVPTWEGVSEKLLQTYNQLSPNHGTLLDSRP